MIRIEAANSLPRDEFIDHFGGIYEHSPWVASRAYEKRPFPSAAMLADAMRDAVDAAIDDEKMALIQAHPDLAGKLARAGALTADSTREQAGLGLDRLSDALYERISALNTAYRERFGFPFILCARLNTLESMLESFETRLSHDRETEILEALRQIHWIARLRLGDKFGESLLS